MIRTFVLSAIVASATVCLVYGLLFRTRETLGALLFAAVIFVWLWAGDLLLAGEVSR